MDNQSRITESDLQIAETIKCKNCGGIYFKPTIIMKKLSALALSSKGKEEIVSIQVVVCEACKTPAPFEEENIKKLNL